jgi:hypothetical protein
MRAECIVVMMSRLREDNLRGFAGGLASRSFIKALTKAAGPSTPRD